MAGLFAQLHHCLQDVDVLDPHHSFVPKPWQGLTITTEPEPSAMPTAPDCDRLYLASAGEAAAPVAGLTAQLHRFLKQDVDVLITDDLQTLPMTHHSGY